MSAICLEKVEVNSPLPFIPVLLQKQLVEFVLMLFTVHIYNTKVYSGMLMPLKSHCDNSFSLFCIKTLQHTLIV